jgi:hypothetical protein
MPLVMLQKSKPNIQTYTCRESQAPNDPIGAPRRKRLITIWITNIAILFYRYDKNYCRFTDVPKSKTPTNAALVVCSCPCCEISYLYFKKKTPILGEELEVNENSKEVGYFECMVCVLGSGNKKMTSKDTRCLFDRKPAQEWQEGILKWSLQRLLGPEKHKKCYIH